LIQQLDQATPLQPVLGLASNKFTARQAAQQIGHAPDESDFVVEVIHEESAQNKNRSPVRKGLVTDIV
jgi:hypothetical protein